MIALITFTKLELRLKTALMSGLFRLMDIKYISGLAGTEEIYHTKKGKKSKRELQGSSPNHVKKTNSRVANLPNTG